MTLTPAILEVPHVAADQNGAFGSADGGNPAVGLADRPARDATLGRDLCVDSGGGAVEREDPLSEALLEPPGHGGFRRISPFAGRYDRDAVAQFRLRPAGREGVAHLARNPRDLEPPVRVRLLDLVPEPLQPLRQLRPVDRPDRLLLPEQPVIDHRAPLPRVILDHVGHDAVSMKLRIEIS